MDYSDDSDDSVEIEKAFKYQTCVLMRCRATLAKTVYMTPFGPMCSLKCRQEFDFPGVQVKATLNPTHFREVVDSSHRHNNRPMYRSTLMESRSHVSAGMLSVSVDASKMKDQDPGDYWLCKLLNGAGANFRPGIAKIVSDFLGPPYTHTFDDMADAIRVWKWSINPSKTDKQRCIDILTSPLLVPEVYRLCVFIFDDDLRHVETRILRRRDETPITVADLWIGHKFMSDVRKDVDFYVLDGETVCRALDDSPV